MSDVIIKSIHITEMHEKTWGRVYIQYEINGVECFIFKNWLFFDEKTYKGQGNLLSTKSDYNDEKQGRHHSIYLWFPSEKRHVYKNYKDVLKGDADHLVLTRVEHKEKYGTPSKILKRLLIELRANIGEPIENRKDWYKRYQGIEIILSPILVNEKNKILLTLYDNLEIKLEPMQKLVYLFFLKHPKGIKIADIPDYKIELLSIYNKISTSSDKNKIIKRIDELTDLTSNSIHEKISKINKVIKEELGEKLAMHYFIMGSAGQLYKINLSNEQIKII